MPLVAAQPLGWVPTTSSEQGVSALHEPDLEAQAPGGTRRGSAAEPSLLSRKGWFITGAVLSAVIVAATVGGIFGARAGLPTPSGPRAPGVPAADPAVDRDPGVPVGVGPLPPTVTTSAAPVATTSVTTTASSTSSTSTSRATPTARPTEALFSVYKDVSTDADASTHVISTRVTGAHRSVVDALPDVGTVRWAFARGECGSETWGGKSSISADAMAKANVDAWAEAGKPYMLSTGGAGGTFTCESDASFSKFLDRYMSSALVGVDFDIESGESPEQIEHLVARAQAAQNDPRYAHLRFTFTVGTFGSSNGRENLGDTGKEVLGALKRAGLKDASVNLMTMDYGTTSEETCTLGDDGRCDMGASAVAAAKSLHDHGGVPYSRIEVTPMIGVNDMTDEVFSLEKDVGTVAEFAKQVGLGGVHLWSIDRDRGCGPGPAPTAASATCSGDVDGDVLAFTDAFRTALG